jgi:1-acyl-sn-glycerol-3-phosphate acyltransferase
MKDEIKEIQNCVHFISEHPSMHRILAPIFNEAEKMELLALLRSINNKRDFITKFTYSLVERIINKTTSQFSYTGTEHLDSNESYLFISNHRNIVMDGTLLNFIAVLEKLKYAVMVVGDNLLVDSFTKTYFDITDCFVIKRGVTVRELLKASMESSQFIRSNIVSNQNSIWIAHREGRTKSGKDLTQNSIFKMLMMSGKTKDFKINLRELNIVPLSITYEYNPCDALFLMEKERKEKGLFTRNKRYDAVNMFEGIIGQKGAVNYSFDKPLNQRLNDFNSLEDISNYFDEYINSNIKKYSANTAAVNLLNNNFEAKNTEEEELLNYAKRQLSRYHKLNLDSLKEFLEYYAHK